MRFKIDENLPVELALDLRSRGHAADTVQDEELSGRPDAEIVANAQSGNRIVVTLDKGIADILRFPITSHVGVVLVRPGTLGRQAVLAFIRQRLSSLLGMELAGRITVVTTNRIRSR